MKMEDCGLSACDVDRSRSYPHSSVAPHVRMFDALDRGLHSNDRPEQRKFHPLRYGEALYSATTPTDLAPIPETYGFIAADRARRRPRRIGHLTRAEFPGSTSEFRPHCWSAHPSPVGDYPTSPPHRSIQNSNQGVFDTKFIFPCFDGESHDEDYLDWEKFVDNFFYYACVPLERQVRCVVRKLTGRAAAWWSHLVQARRHEGRNDVKTWSKMKRLLREQFLSPYYENQLSAVSNKDKRHLDGANNTLIEWGIHMSSKKIKTNNDLGHHLKKNEAIELPDGCISKRSDMGDNLSIPQTNQGGSSLSYRENGLEKLQDFIISEKNEKFSGCDEHDLEPKEALTGPVEDQFTAMPCNNSNSFCSRSNKEADQSSHPSILEALSEEEEFSIDCFGMIRADLHNFLDTSDGRIEVKKGVGKFVAPFEKTKIVAYVLGVMVPCMRLYAFLGKEPEPFPSLYGSAHPYTNGVKNYSASSFEEVAAQIGELLDKLSVPLNGDELDVIQKLYHQAMKLVTDFLLAQPIVQPSVVPLSKLHDSKYRFFIFSDSDLIYTVLDSSAILAETAIIKASKSIDFIDVDSPINQMSSSNLRNYWRNLFGQNTEEHEQFIESLLPDEEAKTFVREGDYINLCERAQKYISAKDVPFITNDLHTGLLPCHLKSTSKAKGIYLGPTVIVCIHNIAYQDRFAFSNFMLLNLPNHPKTSFVFLDGYDELVKERKIRMMKADFIEPDTVLTVFLYCALEFGSAIDKSMESDNLVQVTDKKGIAYGVSGGAHMYKSTYCNLIGAFLMMRMISFPAGLLIHMPELDFIRGRHFHREIFEIFEDTSYGFHGHKELCCAMLGQKDKFLLTSFIDKTVHLGRLRYKELLLCPTTWNSRFGDYCKKGMVVSAKWNFDVLPTTNEVSKLDERAFPPKPGW